MEKAKENEFEISMFFIGLRHVNQNIERVALRVKNGGHDIPTEDILKRNTTSLENLLEYIYLIDHLVVIDNSRSDGELILEASNGTITFESVNLPYWVSPIKNKIENNSQKRHIMII